MYRSAALLFVRNGALRPAGRQPRKQGFGVGFALFDNIIYVVNAEDYVASVWLGLLYVDVSYVDLFVLG